MSLAISTLHRWLLLGVLLIAAALVSVAFSSTVPITLASNEHATAPLPSPPSIEQQLQIKQLQQETSWEGRVQGYLPAGSALAALAAAGWGVFVYLRDQRRNFQLRTQMEISNNLSRLIEHEKGEAIKSSQIISALTTLNALADQSPNKGRLLKEVTTIITAAIMEDIDFNDVSQVRFETLCLGNWMPYEIYLGDNPDERRYILYRYLSALRELRIKHGSYVSRVNWDAKSMRFTHPASELMPESDFQLFQRLIQGIRSHSQRIGDDSRRADLKKQFQMATGNDNLTLQVLGEPKA